MASDDFGIVIAQQGVDVGRSADYQRVLDSRWRFVEVELEIPINIELPAQPAILFADSYNEDTPLVRHSLGFLAPFEHNLTVLGVEIEDSSVGIHIYSDSRTIFLRRFISVNPFPAVTITGRLRVYNVRIIDAFEAQKDFPVPSAGASTGPGFRAVDGSVPNLGPADQSPVGYSIDTEKKILSIHKNGVADINPWVRKTASVTAIDTTTDIFTVANNSSSRFNWIADVGTPVSYDSHDHATYPTPITNGPTYYVIPVDATHIKLAASLSDSQSGIAINVTATGALPGFIAGVDQSAGEAAKIYHNVGYPPTYLLAPLKEEGDTYLLGPFLHKSAARTKATPQYLQFLGAQANFSGVYAYMVLKDPAELAQ